MDTRLNVWSKLKFVDPAEVLPQLRKIQESVALSDLDYKIKNLRTQKLKGHREAWEATLFCYGLSLLLKTTVFVAPYEDSDYDAVTLRVENDIQHYTPIQLKEVVSVERNPRTSISQEITKLKKRYPTSNDTVVVMRLNRKGKLNLLEIEIPKLNIAQLWFLGTSSEDQSKWFIAGDMLDHPSIFEFDHPA